MLSATPPLIWWPALVYWTASETSTALVSKVAGKSGEVPRATASEARTVPANPLCFHSRRAALKPARNSLARSDPGGGPQPEEERRAPGDLPVKPPFTASALPAADHGRSVRREPGVEAVGADPGEGLPQRDRRPGVAAGVAHPRRGAGLLEGGIVDPQQHVGGVRDDGAAQHGADLERRGGAVAEVVL